MCWKASNSFTCLCGSRKKKRLETSFKGDNGKTLIKTSNDEKLALYFSEKSQKISAFSMLVWFSVTKQSLENLKMFFASPNDQKYPRFPLVLKYNVTLARPLRLVIPYFLMETLVR